MNQDLTEEEMRRALFGSADAPTPVPAAPPEAAPSIVSVTPVASKKAKAARTFTPKLRVTLRVGNEFEGATELFAHDADTLSKLQAELDAIKAARKKFRYIELVSIKSV